MEQKILAFSGRAQAGKNTGCNFLASLILQSSGICEQAWLNKKGMVQVSDLLGQKEYEGILDLQSFNPNTRAFLTEYVDPFVKIYSFADLLKKNVCMDVLGLTYEQCYTEEGKNSETHILWENIPNSNKVGRMTAREVLQQIGTQTFRKIYPGVWSDGLIKRIKSENSALALICDCRFPNEADAVLEAGGTVIRLTRNITENAHSSETALDDYPKFSHIIDNSNMNIGQQCKATYELVKNWECLPEVKYE